MGDCLINIWHQQSLPKKTNKTQTTNFFLRCSFDSWRNLQAYRCSFWFYINTTEAEPGNALSSLKTSSYLVSKSSRPVFLIDSRWSCAAHWHDIRDCEVERATLSVLVVSRINIRSHQRKGNEKVITEGWFLCLFQFKAILQDLSLLSADFGLWYWAIQYCKPWDTDAPNNHRARAATDKGRLLSQHSSPDMQHKEVAGRDNNYRRNPVNWTRACQPDRAIRSYWNNKKSGDEELAEINTTSISTCLLQDYSTLAWLWKY